MMGEPGTWVKIDRNIMSWEWYKNPGVKALFLHLILKAYISDGKYMGKTIRRGQLPTTAAALADELGLSVRSVRSYLEHLRQTNEIATRSCGKYTVVTVKNYELYQEETAKGKRRSYRKPKPPVKKKEPDAERLPQWWELNIPKELWGRFATEDEYWEYAAHEEGR